MPEVESSELLEAATRFAKAGFRVVQLHYIEDSGSCSCGETADHAEGKHPVVSKWQTRKPLSAADVWSLWGEDDAKPWNVGLATGWEFWVLDYDPDRASEEAEALVEKLQGDGFEPAVVTGSGGFHWYFSMPEWILGNGRGSLPKGFDVRGRGGQVVVPPSVSAKGPYVALGDLSEFPAAPDYIITAVEPKTESPELSADDRREYDSLSGIKKARVNSYVEKTVSKIVDKLKDLRDLPMGETPGWDETTFKLSCDLLELAHSPWNAMTEAEAYQYVFANAPRDAGFTDKRVNDKFSSALQKTKGKARPAPGFVSEPDEIPADPKKIDKATVRLEDAYLVECIAADLSSKWRWCSAFGWLKWDGKRWHADRPEPEIRNAVRTWVMKLLRAQKDSERLKKVAGKMSNSALGGLTGLLRGVPGILCESDDFDTYPDLLNVNNGVLDLRTGELVPHNPELLLTKLCPVDYEAGFTTDDWEKAKDALPPEPLKWFQVRLGQALTGHTPPDDVLIVCQGGGENGKSSIMEPVSRAMGDHFVLMSDRVLLGSSEIHPTEKMDLWGARMALLEETPEARRLNVTSMKQIIGSTHIRARRIGKDTIEYEATHTGFLNTNFELQVDETDRGTWRRLLLLKFPYSFRKPYEELRNEWERHGDEGLRDRLKNDQENWKAALAWTVEGAKRWYTANRRMPTPPKSVLDDTLAWRASSDLILGFWEDNLVADHEAYVASSDLLHEVNEWLKDHGHKPWSDRTLKTRLLSNERSIAARVREERVRASATPGLSRPGSLIEPSVFAPSGGLARPLPERFRVYWGIRFSKSDIRGGSDDTE